MIFKIKDELVSSKKYLSVSILISFLTVLPQLIIAHSIRHVVGLIILLTLLVVIGKISKLLFMTFTIYLNIINIVQLNIYMHWGSLSFMYDRFEVAVRSPFYETIEYLNTYVDYRDYLFILYSFIVIIVAYKLIYKYSHNYKIVKKISILFSVILFIFLYSKEPLNVVTTYLEIRNDFLYNNVILKSRARYLNEYNKTRKEHNSSNLVYNKIIIIQGESVNKIFFNAYGYDKNTSPFISKLVSENQAYKFNAISAANLTRYSVPMAFTKANVKNWKSNFLHSESILSNFEDYGYKTYWISNQGRIGKHDDWITSIANEANVTKYFNQSSFIGASKMDIEILNYLKSVKNNKNPEMYVFHLMGSHFAYSKRYTKEHSLYRKPKDRIEEYLNSLYYTDFIIKNIFNYFKNSKNVLIVYLSDHGEVVSHKRCGHGSIPTYKDEYEIPLIIYSSIKNKRIEELVKINENHLFNTENMNYIIKYISNISNDNNISYSSEIFALNPQHRFDFNKLKDYK